MQKILNLSKFVVLLAISCSLLLVWYSNEIDVRHFVPSYTNTSETDTYRDEVSTSQTAITPSAVTPSKATPVIAPATPVTPAPSTKDATSTKDAISYPSSSGNIWDTLRSEFRLDTRTQSPQVQAEIRKLLAEPNKLSNIFKAAVPYIYFIHQQVNDRGLPAELALIPVIESEFNPNDVSTAGATGLWQFMAPTARELGIPVRSGYDGRRNVIASTKAALAYFKDLGVLFKGNWYLALAAYNCGQGKVMSLMRKTGSNSFWNLPLPQETKFYVPRLLAVAAIVKNPEKYGVTLPKTANQPYFTEVKVSKPVNIPEIAKATGVNIDTLHKLNPDYTRGSSPKKEARTFLVPVAHAQKVTASLSA